MTRLGKIARLPRVIRDQLNIRLQNGEVGRQLVGWLNGLPETAAMLQAQFGGRPINEQNLTEWKQGGYEDWLRHQENCMEARLLTENATELEKEAGEVRLEDRLAAPVALALARLLREATESSEGTDTREALLDVARELAELRRASHDAERVRLERERWEAKQAEASEARRKEAEKKAKSEAHFEECRAQYLALTGVDPLNPANLLPAELAACLKASARLRCSNGEPVEAKNGNLQETRRND